MKNLRSILISSFTLVVSNYLSAQHILHTTDTAFRYCFSKEGEKITGRFIGDTMRLGTRAYHNSFVIYAGADSVIVSQDRSRKLEDQHT
jgi:hypothetical protein